MDVIQVDDDSFANVIGLNESDSDDDWMENYDSTKKPHLTLDSLSMPLNPDYFQNSTPMVSTLVDRPHEPNIVFANVTNEIKAYGPSDYIARFRCIRNERNPSMPEKFSSNTQFAERPLMLPEIFMQTRQLFPQSQWKPALDTRPQMQLISQQQSMPQTQPMPLAQTISDTSSFGSSSTPKKAIIPRPPPKPQPPKEPFPGTISKSSHTSCRNCINEQTPHHRLSTNMLF